jgi:hypothetical protein
MGYYTAHVTFTAEAGWDQGIVFGLPVRRKFGTFRRRRGDANRTLQIVGHSTTRKG